MGWGERCLILCYQRLQNKYLCTSKASEDASCVCAKPSVKVNSRCARRRGAAPSLTSLFLSAALRASPSSSPSSSPPPFFHPVSLPVLLNRIHFSCQSPPSLHHFLITLLSLMSSVMYTGGSGEGPICDFHIRSDQRKAGENKSACVWRVVVVAGGGRIGSHNFLPFLLLFFFLKRYIFLLASAGSQERGPASNLGCRGNRSALPEPPFWKHPLERRAKWRRVPPRATGREIKENADVYSLES